MDIDQTNGANETPQRIMALQESARRRISEYLHGHVQSKLLALQYHLSRCQELILSDPQEAFRMLERVRGELQRLQDNDIRQASHDLYPSVIRLGLLPALRSLRDRLNGAVPTELVVGKELSEMDGTDGKKLSEEFRIGVCRIVEEGLGNVVKHARATEANVGLHFSGIGGFSLSIEDNGCGFDMSKVSFGLGLIAMRDYAETLHAGFNVDTGPGRGTKVHVILSSYH